MSVFWFLAGMLTTVAVLLVLLPWLRTVPGLGTLPAFPWQLPVIALVMAGAAATFYHLWGRPDLLSQGPALASAEPMARGASAASAGAGATAAGSMNAAVTSLRARLEKGGGGPGDWELLAKSYEFMGRPDAASQARAHQLPADTEFTAPPCARRAGSSRRPSPPKLSAQSQALLAQAAHERADKHYAAAQKISGSWPLAKQMNADAWADYADTAGTLQGGKLAGEPETFIANALALDPMHPKALWLQASGDEEAGRHAEAITAWQRLLAVLPKESEDAKLVEQNLERERLAVAAPSAAVIASVAPPGASIDGEVTIENSLKSRAAAGATLFIVAKSVDLPGPPVAVYRGRVDAWPVKFTLDDSLSMLPGRNLSSAKHVTVEARVSASGQAQPAPGDLRGTTGVIDPTSRQPLQILINEVVS